MQKKINYIKHKEGETFYEVSQIEWDDLTDSDQSTFEWGIKNFAFLLNTPQHTGKEISLTEFAKIVKGHYYHARVANFVNILFRIDDKNNQTKGTE